MKMTIYKRIEALEIKAAEMPNMTGWHDIGEAIAAVYGGPYEPMLVSPRLMADLEKAYGPRIIDIQSLE
jgi:hypothetical protein